MVIMRDANGTQRLYIGRVRQIWHAAFRSMPSSRRGSPSAWPTRAPSTSVTPGQL
jgi:hypothetical protein